MYRIELAPGEETVFRTIEELAIGVRNGLVTPRCRIYHNASQKWLPIEFHPHYKKALALPASRVAEAVAPKPAGRPRIDTVSFAVKPPVTRPDSAPIAEPTAEAQTAAPKPTGTEPPERQIRKRLPIGRAQAMGPRVELPEPSAAPHRVGELRTSEQPATEPPIAEQPKAVQPSVSRARNRRRPCSRLPGIRRWTRSCLIPIDRPLITPCARSPGRDSVRRDTCAGTSCAGAAGARASLPPVVGGGPTLAGGCHRGASSRGAPGRVQAEPRVRGA